MSWITRRLKAWLGLCTQCGKPEDIPSYYGILDNLEKFCSCGIGHTIE